MKKGLKLLLMYFIFLLVFLLCGTLIYALFLNIQNYVAGGQNSSFNFVYIERAFFFMSSCVLVFICPLICYYRIRHPYGVVQTLFYILICCITWAVLFPVVKIAKDKAYENLSMEVKPENLTKYIFRENNGHVYYFLRDFYTDSETLKDTPAIVIYTSEDGDMDIAEVADTKDFELYEAAKPYQEILIKNALPLSRLSNLINLELIIRRGELALQKGITFFLGFLTLGFVLCSLYALTNYYSWKLISVVMLILETAVILSVNTVYYYPAFGTFIFKITNNGFFNFLNHYMDEPLLCFMNLITGIVFIIIGIIHFAIKKHNKKA